MPVTSGTSPLLVKPTSPVATPLSSLTAKAVGAIGGARPALPLLNTSTQRVSSPDSLLRLMRLFQSFTMPLA